MAATKIKDVNLKIGTENQFQSKLKDLPLNTLVGTTDPIQEGELDTSIITKLNKADNALPKPTNDTTGSAGDVLSKTANGSEWKTIKGLPDASPSVGAVLGCTTEGTPEWVPLSIYNHYMSFEIGSGDKITLTKISTRSDSFSNLTDAYQGEMNYTASQLGDPALPIPVVGMIESNSQKFSAIAITGDAAILFYEAGQQIDISDLTNWADEPIQV